MRLILLMLALTMTVGILAGCGGKKPDESGEQSGTVRGSGGDVTEEDIWDESLDENGYLRDDLPDSLDYNNEEIRIMSWNAFFTEFEVESYTDNQIDNSVFRRDQMIQDRLNVSLSYTEQAGRHDNYSQYVTRVRNLISGGLQDSESFDILAGYTRSIAGCASTGLLLDLNSYGGYIDLDKPWWNPSVIEATSLMDTVFYCTGDASTSFIQQIYCVYFNEDLMKTLRLESPYTLVANNEWTLEKMLELGENFYQDINSTNQIDLGDKIPLAGQYFDYPALLHGCGVGYTSRDALGDFTLSDDANSAKAFRIMDDLILTYVEDDCAFVGRDNQNDMISQYVAGNVMFCLTQSGATLRYVLDSQFQYGCVPVPKYDSDQENYISTVDQKITFFAMHKGLEPSRREMVTAVIECRASEGYRRTTPVIFETVMQTQKSRSDEMMAMLQVIRETAWFDLSRIHAPDIGICDRPGNLLEHEDTWSGWMNSNADSVRTKIEALSGNMKEYLGN